MENEVQNEIQNSDINKTTNPPVENNQENIINNSNNKQDIQVNIQLPQEKTTIQTPENNQQNLVAENNQENKVNTEVPNLKPIQLPNNEANQMSPEINNIPSQLPQQNNINQIAQPMQSVPNYNQYGDPTQIQAVPLAEKSSPNFKSLLDKIKSIGKGPIILGSIIIILVIGCIIGKTIISSPKMVFKTALNRSYNKMSETIDYLDEISNVYDINNKAIIMNADVKFDTDLTELKEQNIDINGMTFGGGIGIDVKNEILDINASIKGTKEEITLNAQYIKGITYITSNFFEEIIKTEEKDEINFEEIKETLKQLENETLTNPKDYDYIIKTLKDALVKSLKSEYMDKDKVKIDVLDNTIKVQKNSFELEEDSMQELIKNITNYLLDDDKFIEKISKLTDTPEDEIKEELKELKKSAKDIETDDEVYINIYTRGLFNSFAGISIEYEDKEYISLYTDGKNTELIIDNHETSSYSKTKINLTIEKTGKEYDIKGKYNGEKVLEVRLKEYTEEVIDLDYKFIVDNETISGSFYFSGKEAKDNITGNYKFKINYEEEKFGVDGKYSISAKENINKINTEKAISEDQVDINKIKDNLNKKLTNDERLNNLFSPIITELEKEKLNLDYNNMSSIYGNEELNNVLKSQKPTILYIGSRSYTTATEQYYMLQKLVSVLKELDYYSYYFSEYSTISEETRKILNEVQYTCNTTAVNEDQTPALCQDFPVIYLIKDGKIVKAYKGNIELEEFKSTLKQIGIE